MLICKQENHFLPLNSKFVVENLQIFPEVIFIVASAQSDLKDFTTGGKGSQFGQALFSASTCNMT